MTIYEPCFLHVLSLFFAGTYQGQWLRGMRHGYGVRTSAPFGVASQTTTGGGLDEMRGSESSLSAPAKTPAGVVGAAVSSLLPDKKRDRSTASEVSETRGGFVLRSRSDEVPRRRRSLVERSGMKGLVQVRL